MFWWAKRDAGVAGQVAVLVTGESSVAVGPMM
jgi:hypothetical protein